MKRNIIISICCLVGFLFSCNTIKKSTYTKDVSLLKEQLKESIIKSEKISNSLYIYKDSLTTTKALLEKSSSFGQDSSYLETSYSFSIASIDTKGKLSHSIQNKDSIPNLTIIKKEYIKTRFDSLVYVHDTTYIEKTSDINQSVEKVKSPFLTYLKIIAGTLIFGFIVIVILKVKKIISFN